jgi:hypothetical protein
VLDARNPFGFEGYLSMMIGMNVPYRRTYNPPGHETLVWNNVYQRMQSIARQAVTVKEALSCIRQPWWQWRTDLYAEG